MNEVQAREALRGLPHGDPEAIFKTGIQLIRADYGELLLPAARQAAARFPSEPRMHQLLGLAARQCGESATALPAFEKAAHLSPRDALIAHSHARAALEAGKPASELFDLAARLAPQDGSVLLGRAAARIAEGEATRALEELRDVLRQSPLWTEGQRSCAQILAQQGLDPVSVLDLALAAHPAEPELHRCRISILLQGREIDRARRAIAEAMARLGNTQWLVLHAAHAASEAGELDEASRLFAALGQPGAIDHVSLLARHHIRLGQADLARSLLEPWIARDRDHLLWPYLSLAWRMTDDPRWTWLEGDPALVQVFDIGEEAGDLAALAQHLTGLHFAAREPLDQSVRGGTQTDGNLLLRTDPPIAGLKRALMDAVTRYCERLPPFEPGHPTLLARREPLRIAGSWSVKLSGAGFHSDHVHSHGWISSAFYVSLPEAIDDSPRQEGWLTLGQSRDLVPQLAPVMTVKPQPGRLVLFPSTMWHGTRPFSAGDRLTAAFDIARPKQG